MTCFDLKSVPLMVHMAGVCDRASIQAHGLLPRHPDGHSGAEQWGNPVGVYMYELAELEKARSDMGRSYDAWIVDTSGLELEQDLTIKRAWFVAGAEPVAAERLTLYVPGETRVPVAA